MIHNFIFYIHSDILNPDNFTDDVLKRFIKDISPILEVARQIRAKVFYSINDIQYLNKTIDDLDEFFIKSKANILDVFLKDFNPIKQNNYCFEVLFSDENTSLKHINLPFLNSNYINDKHVIFNLTLNKQMIILFIKNEADFCKLKLDFFNNSKSIWDFINSNTFKRNYNFSQKHGNDKIKCIAPNSEIPSQLLCSDAEAQELLNNAIFDLNHRERFYCNFDEHKNKYILFPFEGDNPQNKFHAFHLDESEWSSKIPKSIRKYFGK